MLASAFDKGQSLLAALAISWNFASPMLGTLACVVSAMWSMTKPSPSLDRRTLAVFSVMVLLLFAMV